MNYKTIHKSARTLLILTAFSALLLSSPHTSAANTGNLDTSVSVTAACSLSVDDTSHSASVIPGNNVAIGTSTVTAICNDPSGLAVYMVGYTGSQYGNTTLTAAINETTQTIPTAVVAPSPSNSQWNVTINAVTGTYTPTIPQEFNNTAHVIPTTYTKVAYRNTMTDMGPTATGANFTAAFNAYVSMTQPAGTYTGKVKVLLVHPNITSSNPTTYAPNTILVLQDVTNWANDVALNQEVEAMDIRDNQMYKVKRLKMNAAGTETALWMSNLNLGAEDLEVSQLDHTNTNLALGVSAISASTFNSWIKTSGTYSYTDPELIPITASNSTTGSTTDFYGNKYGTLYNYAAATAGTYTYASGAGTGNATSDLCPSGWRMPTGGSTGEFQELITDGYNVYDAINYQWNTDGFATTQQNLGFSLAGGFYDNTPSGQGSRGIYWSSTFYSETSMYDLGFYVDYLSPTYYNSRDFAHSVRCVTDS